jgi:uncharacterized protein (TIGR03435 family)
MNVMFKMRNVGRLILSAVLLLSGGPAFGQTPPAVSTPPTAAIAPATKFTFDVATVKPSAPLDMAKVAADMQAGRMPKFGPNVGSSQAEYSFMSLKDLISIAYKVKAYQITGPDWMMPQSAQRFDILAKMPDGATKDDAPAMLQALLIDRFKLTAHLATQEHPVLALVVAKGGPKLKESTVAALPIDENTPLKPGEMAINLPDGPARVTRNPDGSSTTNMGTKGTFSQRVDMQAQTVHLVASTLTMDGLADLLNQVMQAGGGSSRQVVNMTDLKGAYQVTLDISIADMLANARAQGVNIPGAPAGGGGVGEASDPSSGGATISGSMHTLGLNLEPRKAPIEQLVIDHAEKAPTDN